MKLYSNTLTGEHILAAVAGQPYGLARFNVNLRTRVRRRGYDVLLYRTGSRRHFNTGKWGAGEEGAASWDDWGAFLSSLYAIDPEMVAGTGAGAYKGRRDFHTRTGAKYMQGEGEPEVCRVEA